MVTRSMAKDSVEWKVSEAPVGYEEALAFMDAQVAGIHEGREPECVWLLEHPALYTAGTSAKDGDLLDERFPVFKTGRGGEYTYHGPGQRVAYAMLNLKARQKAPDLKKYVWNLEEWIIQTLAEFEVTGERRCGRIGIWVDMPDGSEKKIAAIGVRVRRWVTMHGIAINLNPDLSHFDGIVPCGILEHGVTSLADLGVDTEMGEVDEALKKTFENTF